MAEWIEPIFDRTQNDVESAMRQIALWKANGVAKPSELKGCLNMGDLNRIEKDIQFLSDNLSALYYFSKVNTKTWQRSTLPTVSEINRILNNIKILISSFYQSEDAPDLPTTVLSYEHLNSIEENLHLLKEMLDNMIGSFRECGTLYCGEE